MESSVLICSVSVQGFGADFLHFDGSSPCFRRAAVRHFALKYRCGDQYAVFLICSYLSYQVMRMSLHALPPYLSAEKAIELYHFCSSFKDVVSMCIFSHRAAMVIEWAAQRIKRRDNHRLPRLFEIYERLSVCVRALKLPCIPYRKFPLVHRQLNRLLAGRFKGIRPRDTVGKRVHERKLDFLMVAYFFREAKCRMIFDCCRCEDIEQHITLGDWLLTDRVACPPYPILAALPLHSKFQDRDIIPPETGPAIFSELTRLNVRQEGIIDRSRYQRSKSSADP